MKFVVSALLHAALIAALALVLKTEAPPTPLQATINITQTPTIRAGTRRKINLAPLPASEVKAADTSATPVNSATAANPALQDYLSGVLDRIQSQADYPPALQRTKTQGTATIRVSILPDGTLATNELTQSSGSDELDRIALQTVRRAAPFEEFKSTLPNQERLTFLVPIAFTLGRN